MIFRAALSHRFLLLLLSSPALPPPAVRSVYRAGLQLQYIRPAAARRPPRASGIAAMPHPPACSVRAILPVRHCPYLYSARNNSSALSASISRIKIFLPRHLFQPASDGKEPNAWRLILRPSLNSGGVCNPGVKALTMFLSFTHSPAPLPAVPAAASSA